jgi:hypothetical protein
MAHPQVVDGGNGFQLWRVTANTVNKQARTSDKGWSSSLVGCGAKKTLSVKNKLVANHSYKPWIFWINDLSDRIWNSVYGA